MITSKQTKSIADISERYQKLEKLGEGTYGTVYKVYDLKTKDHLALKKIKTDQYDEGIPSTSLREIAILKTLRHSNIVKLLDIILGDNGDNLYILFEFIEYDLRKFIEKFRSQLQVYLIKSIVYQVLNGVSYLHHNRIFHRDLKPQNILITPKANVKIADFGLARLIQIPTGTLTHEVETLWYRPPEIILGLNHYTLSVDIWSVGCIMAELIKGRPLFMGDSEIDQIFKIFSRLGSPNESYAQNYLKFPEFKVTLPKFERPDSKVAFNFMDSEQISFVMELLKLDPEERITAKTALNHKYFSDIDISTLYDPPI